MYLSSPDPLRRMGASCVARQAVCARFPSRRYSAWVTIPMTFAHGTRVSRGISHGNNAMLLSTAKAGARVASANVPFCCAEASSLIPWSFPPATARVNKRMHTRRTTGMFLQNPHFLLGSRVKQSVWIQGHPPPIYINSGLQRSRHLTFDMLFGLPGWTRRRKHWAKRILQ